MSLVNKNPLVTIIINFYNGEIYLSKAIESVLEQTYSNIELLLYDNLSTDSSRMIAHSYDDSRIRYILAEEFTPLGEARNRALKLSKGEFIGFLDCDDWVEKNKVEATLKGFDDDSVGLVYTNGYSYFTQREKYRPFYGSVHQKEGEMFDYLLSSYHLAIPTVMFRRSVMEALPNWFCSDFSMIEEFDFFLKIAKISKVKYVNAYLGYWRVHSSSLTWSKKHLFEQEMRLFLSRLLLENPELKSTNGVKKYRAKIAFHSFMNEWDKNLNKPNRKILKDAFGYDTKLIALYALSLFGRKFFNKVLKTLGRSIWQD